MRVVYSRDFLISIGAGALADADVAVAIAIRCLLQGVIVLIAYFNSGSG